MDRTPFILICDDNRVIGKSIALLLEPAGYRCVAVSTALDCVAVARRTPPDLILMDIMMPGMDGATASELMRDVPGLDRVPVVFVSAMTEDDVRRRTIDAEAADYLLKPFTKLRLLEVVRRRIDDRRTREMAAPAARAHGAVL